MYWVRILAIRRAHIRLVTGCAKQWSAARDSVAQLVGAESDQIVFMGSGTEVNNTVFHSVVQRAPTGKRVRIVTTTVEHSSIVKMNDYLSARGVEVVSVPVDRCGQLVWEALDEAVTPDTDSGFRAVGK